MIVLKLEKSLPEKLKQFLSTWLRMAEFKVFWFQKANDTKNLLGQLVTD